MSLFDALNTAVSGLNAQSTNFGNISEDVANSQTIGFKRVDTHFSDYLTNSTAVNNTPGSVTATPQYVNNLEGAVTQTDNPLGMAIAGNGFFAVSEATDHTATTTSFSSTPYYTRSGDFTMNAQGYLVNGSGQYLNGWSADPTTGVINQNGAVSPIQVSQSTYKPIATSTVTLSANLPSTPAAGTATSTSPLSSQVTVYDSMGTAHAVTLNWSKDTTAANSNAWDVQVNVPDSLNGSASTPNVGTALVTFGAAGDSNTTLPGASGTAGTIQSIGVASTDSGLGLAGSTAATGSPATFSFKVDFGSGSQTVTMNLGTYGGTSGVTQYAGTTYNQFGMTQNGVAAGSFSGVTTQANGNVLVNYSNGQSSVVAQVPLVTFNNPNGLQSQNGQAFTATTESGSAQTKLANSNGAGNLVVGSVEGSNVDIGTELSHLIVAQQSYSSNAKVVTTANNMLQATLQMIA